MATTNKVLQTRLDREKYIASEQAKYDKSGAMYYCSECEARNESVCEATQEERESKALCAKAFKKWKRD